MKTHFDIQHEGTLGTQDRTAMTFDENSIAHLMTVLTDLYSNPTLAVIREYSTNAADAHAAAGNLAPIEITLPNDFTSILSIKDYGTGMSVDQITNNFSKYGWSSKRGTDNEVGMLGLGCKSGLTYASQFTLVTTNHGIKTTVLVTREESGGGAVQIVDTCSTTDPNGTEVLIPTKNAHDVNTTAMKFFSYWEKGTVLVDGEAPPSVWDMNPDARGIRLDEDIILLPSDKGAPSIIVMGNIAYPIDHNKIPYESRRTIDGMFAVIRVPIGCVNFTPSREALQYNKRTLEVIDDAWSFIYRGVAIQLQNQIDASANAKEAYRLWFQWNSFARSRNLEYKGHRLQDQIKIPDPMRTFTISVRPNFYDADRAVKSDATQRMAIVYHAALHVVGHRGASLSASAKAHIRAYAELHGITDGRVIVYPELFGEPWLTNETVRRVRFDVVQATPLPINPNSKKPIYVKKPKYRTLSLNGTCTESAELPEEVVCWVEASYQTVEPKLMARFAGSGKIASVLGAARNNFVATHPDIPHWEDWVLDELITATQEPCEWRRYYYHIRNTNALYGYSAKFDQARTLDSATEWDLIQDPELRDVWRSLHQFTGEEFTKRLAIARAIARSYDLVLPDVEGTDIDGRIAALAKWYEGLLDVFIGSRPSPYFKAINAFYILKSQLHVIPVY